MWIYITFCRIIVIFITIIFSFPMTFYFNTIFSCVTINPLLTLILS